MRHGIQKRGSAALAQYTSDALEVRANPKQPHDERRVGEQVTSGDDAAHGFFVLEDLPNEAYLGPLGALGTYMPEVGNELQN